MVPQVIGSGLGGCGDRLLGGDHLGMSGDHLGTSVSELCKALRTGHRALLATVTLSLALAQR
jgi:hypothetical protein